jgi:hypothetical protein
MHRQLIGRGRRGTERPIPEITMRAAVVPGFGQPLIIEERPVPEAAPDDHASGNSSHRLRAFA